MISHSLLIDVTGTEETRGLEGEPTETIDRNRSIGTKTLESSDTAWKKTQKTILTSLKEKKGQTAEFSAESKKL